MALKIGESKDSPEKKKGRPSLMRTTLIVSLFFHAAAFLAIHEAFPMTWFTRPTRTFHVELLRPPLDLLEKELKGADLARIKAKEDPSSKETEDTISLDTKDKRYSSYAKAVKRRLLKHWEYPQAARDNLLEGQVLVLFSLNRQGGLLSVTLLQPSRHGILNKETARAIQAASPFPSFPGSVTVTKLNIKANFAYRLTARR